MRIVIMFGLAVSLGIGSTLCLANVTKIKLPGTQSRSHIRLPMPGDKSGVKAVLARQGTDLTKFLSKKAFPGSHVTWVTGSASLGVEIYRIKLHSKPTKLARLEISGPATHGQSHGIGPWRIVRISADVKSERTF